MDVSLTIAFFGGLLTFLSPCVLPLLPIYLSYMAGTQSSGSEVSPEEKKLGLRHSLFNALAFSAGFTVSFVLIGVLFYGVVSQFRTGDLFSKIMGVVLIILGIHTIGIYRIPLLMRDSRKLDVKINTYTIGGSFILGVVFAAGWSPCIGPILATILALSSSSDTMVSAVVMMLTFSFGLAIPFIIAALLVNKASEWASRNSRYTIWVERTTGLFILVFGLILLFVSIHDIAGWMQENVPWADSLLNVESKMLGEE